VDIWTWDLVRANLTKLTFEGAADLCPIWTPDGRRVAFFSDRGEKKGVYWKAADAPGTTNVWARDIIRPPGPRTEKRSS